MQDVKNPATPVKWEGPNQNCSCPVLDWHDAGCLLSAEAAIAKLKAENQQLRTQLASQAELVAAALAWYDDDITPVARRRADTALSKAVEAYRSARSAPTRLAGRQGQS